MVSPVTNFGRNGLYAWLMQRATSVVIMAYMFFIMAFLVSHPDLQYSQWVELHSSLCMRIFGVLTILSIAVHTWNGIWGVLVDYVTPRMLGSIGTPLRIFLELVLIAVVLVYVIWAIDILWGI